MKTPFILLALSLICVIGLSACDQADDLASEDRHAVKTPDPGYLQNTQFDIDAQGRMLGWRLRQHASNTSYAFTSQDAVLILTRNGPEPWGKVSQQFRGDSLKPMLGKTLEFSAEVRTEFTDEYGQAFEPPGLMVLVKGLRAGSPAMMGRRNLLSEKAEVPATLGDQRWQRYAVTFELPDESRASHVDLEVSFLMTLGGAMQIRGASLTEVESAPSL